MAVLKEALARLLPDYLQFWRDICMMETPSRDRDALNTQADFIEAFCKERGFSVRRQAYERAGDALLITLDGDAEKAPVALLAHMDTVHERGAFGTPPVREENGILYGPGVFDCKGGIAVCLLAMQALAESGIAHRTVKLILNSDEENGTFAGEAGVAFMKEAASGACAAFNAEAGRAGSLTVGRKGIISASIKVRGVAGHAGNAYFSSASAIREAAHKVIELEAQSDGDVTYNCGIVRGGSARNIVPAECEIVADIRFWNAEQQRRALEVLERVVQTTHVTGCTATWELSSVRPAMEHTAENEALFEMVKEVANTLKLDPLEGLLRGGGSDSAYTVQIGIPTVCSMGPVGRYEHTVREEADIHTLSERALLMAACILKI